MLLLSPYGYVSRWGVRFWFQNSYFKGKNGYLSLRHSHMFTFFQCLKPSWPTFFLNEYIYIYIYIFRSCDVEKVYAAVARSTFPSQNVKSTRGSDGRSDLVSRGRRKGLCTVSKVSKTWRFCSISINDGRRGTFEEDLQRCISPGRCSTRDMFIRDVRRSGRWFPERGCILEHQICRFPKMILRDRCSTSYDLAWQARCFRQVEWKNRTTHWYEAVSAALNFPFLKEVSQNCFVFDVVKFKNWRSLAELLHFGCSHVQK